MLNHWLEPVNLEMEEFSSLQLGHRIQIHKDSFPDLSKTKIALIGIGTSHSNSIRRALYAMSFPFSQLAVADLGNVRKEDHSFIIAVIEELLAGEIIPILLGSDLNYTLAQFQAYRNHSQAINLVVVDERIRFSLSPEADNSSFLNTILDKKSLLFNLGVIGYQSHYTPTELLTFFDSQHFDTIRLGKVRQAGDEAEPIIRDADLLSFNIAALKYCEAPGVAGPASPSGLFSEEACKISHYAGLSDKLTSIGFYGLDHNNDPNEQTAQVIAQLIWYFMDGVYQRKKDFPVSTDSLTEYIVQFKDINQPVTFWKSGKSGRWWMQIPIGTQEKLQRHRLVPCSYQDYQLACQNEPSERLLNAYRRFT